jgi:hypothetical protein
MSSPIDPASVGADKPTKTVIDAYHSAVGNAHDDAQDISEDERYGGDQWPHVADKKMYKLGNQTGGQRE